MEYLHVTNNDKHNNGYRDRPNSWMKFHFSCYNDNGWTRLCETDQMRFLNFIRLEMQTKSPVLLDNEYLTRQGFDLKSRRLTSTINQLLKSKLIEIKTRTDIEREENRERTDREQGENRERTGREQKPKIVEPKGLKTKNGTQSRIEKSRLDIHVRIFTEWNRMAIKQHRNIDKFIPSINGALEHYSEQELISAMNNYKLILIGKEYYYTHQFTLDKFMSQKNGLENFVTVNKPFEAYKNKSNNFVQDNRNANGVVL